MSYFIKVLVLVIFTLSLVKPNVLSAQTQKHRSVKYTVLPVAYYSPETALALGGFVNGTFYLQDSIYRPSNILLGGAYTFMDQLLFYVPFEFNWNQNKHILKGELGYYRYFYFFFGIGPEDDGEFETYNVNFPRFKLNYLYRLKGAHYLGMSYSMDDYNIIDLPVNHELSEFRITGFEGSFISTVGLQYAFDSRDNLFNPTKGSFITASLQWNSKFFRSDFNFIRFTLDAIHYVTLTKGNILATNLYGGFVSGNIPFQELMLYGGTNKARGYYQGRLRDNALLMIQLEYRFKIYKRFGGVLFGSLGNVGPGIATLDLLNSKYNLGIGLRYMINPADRLNIRMDYAIGKNTSGFYITFGEAF